MVKEYSCKDSENGSNIFPHPSDNTMYIVCNSGYKFYMYCPRGTKFDAERKICMFKSQIFYPELATVKKSTSSKIEENETTASLSDIVGTSDNKAVVPEPIAIIQDVEKESTTESKEPDYYGEYDNYIQCSTLARDGYRCVAL